jgi:hypothetical protein
MKLANYPPGKLIYDTTRSIYPRTYQFAYSSMTNDWHFKTCGTKTLSHRYAILVNIFPFALFTSVTVQEQLIMEATKVGDGKYDDIELD